MEYHEVRVLAELRKQGEHERAEEFRLKVMRRTRRRTPDHLVPSAGTPSDSPPLRVAERYAAGRRHGVAPSNACQEMIQAGTVWADDPVLNQTPPPKNLNMADAQKGCLDTLHKRLGY